MYLFSVFYANFVRSHSSKLHASLDPIYSYDSKFVIKLRLSYLQNIIYKKN